MQMMWENSYLCRLCPACDVTNSTIQNKVNKVAIICDMYAHNPSPYVT